MLTMSAVLRPDVTSSFWSLIGPTHTLDADWSKITITRCRRGSRHCMTLNTLNILDIPGSLQITQSCHEHPLNAPVIELI